jgi:hypothetical protein
LALKGAQAQHHGDVADIPPFPQHHDADDDFDPIVRPVDIACRLAGLFKVLLGDLSSGVSVNHENLGLLEAKLLRLPEVLAEGVGVDVLLGHDEEHRLYTQLSVDAPVVFPALHGGPQPVTIFLSDVVPGNAIGVLVGPLGIALSGDDQWRLDDTILHRLRHRVVADRPGEVHRILVLGRGREVEPEAKTGWQGSMDCEQ